jgi:hypothetical protein
LVIGVGFGVSRCFFWVGFSVVDGKETRWVVAGERWNGGVAGTGTGTGVERLVLLVFGPWGFFGLVLYLIIFRSLWVN